MERIRAEQLESGVGPVARRVVVDVAPMRAVVLRFAPGFALPQHHHPVASELYVVLEGVGELEVGDDRETIGPGDIVHLRPNDAHTFTVGDEPLTLLAVVAPNLPEHVMADGRVLAPADALADARD
jgi:quercetin dioxygenase-like cupin family protein